MAGLLSNLRSTVIVSLILAGGMFALYYVLSGGDAVGGHRMGQAFLRWTHVLAGVMWIGLLWYFNFVQIPNMPKIPDDQKPAIGKVIAPAALFWFRWAALATLVTGLALMGWTGDILDAMTLGIVGAAEDAFVLKNTAIGIGMWMGIIMAFNVWGVIWPNQKKALGIVQVDADAKKRAARTAMLFSRTNTLLSIPMLYAMVSAQNIY